MHTSNKKESGADAACIRFGKRTAVALPAQLSVDGKVAGQGIICNASISGAFIETSLELPLHTNLVVTVPKPGDGAPAAHTLSACVVRTDATGLGIEWRDMASLDILGLLRGS